VFICTLLFALFKHASYSVDNDANVIDEIQTTHFYFPKVIHIPLSLSSHRETILKLIVSPSITLNKGKPTNHVGAAANVFHSLGKSSRDLD